jgi:hypothetical protein
MVLEDTSNSISAAVNGGLDYIERRLAFSRSMVYPEANLEPEVRQNRRTKPPSLLPGQGELGQYLQSRRLTISHTKLTQLLGGETLASYAFQGYGIHLPNRPFQAPFQESYNEIAKPYRDELFYYALRDRLDQLQKGKRWQWAEIRCDVVVCCSKIRRFTKNAYVGRRASFLTAIPVISRPSTSITFLQWHLSMAPERRYPIEGGCALIG